MSYTNTMPRSILYPKTMLSTFGFCSKQKVSAQSESNAKNPRASLRNQNLALRYPKTPERSWLRLEILRDSRFAAPVGLL